MNRTVFHSAADHPQDWSYSTNTRPPKISLCYFSMLTEPPLCLWQGEQNQLQIWISKLHADY